MKRHNLDPDAQMRLLEEIYGEKAIVSAVERNRENREIEIDFSKIRMRNVSAHAYTVIAAARSICTGSGQVTDADLANPEIVGIDAFRLIVHALLIVRYGLNVLNITTKKAV